MPYYNIQDLGKKREDVSPLAEIQSVVGELMKFGTITWVNSVIGLYQKAMSYPFTLSLHEPKQS